MNAASATLPVGASDIVAIVVNGQPQTLIASSTVADLLAARGLTGQRVAVERNGMIVPRSRHADTVLSEDDRLEIVVAVGGG